MAANLFRAQCVKHKEKLTQLSDNPFNYAAHDIVTSDAIQFTHTELRTITINGQRVYSMQQDVLGRHCVRIPSFLAVLFI